MKNFNFVKQTGVVLTIFTGFMIVLYFMGGTASASGKYISRTPELQAGLNALEVEYQVKKCEQVRKLATSKLEDDMNGIVIENIDRNDLAKKRDATCTPQELVF